MMGYGCYIDDTMCSYFYVSYYCYTGSLGAKQMFIVIAIYSRNVDRVPTTGQVMKETCNKQVNISMSRVVRDMKKTKAEEGDSV